MAVTITQAQEADVPDILRFIFELARYEKLEHEVEATEEALKVHLFGPRPAAEVVFVEHDGERAGFALFFPDFSTFLAKPGLYLEDLYVRPEKRGRGLGRALLAHLARIALERGCGRLEWWVLNWNEDAIGFYRSLGAEPMSDWTVQRVAGEALTALAASAPP